jgi:hypothetical protein
VRLRFAVVALAGLSLLGSAPALAARPCTITFPASDQSAVFKSHLCDCFDKLPRGTKIYLVDMYRVEDGDSTAFLPPDSTFSCDVAGLSVEQVDSPGKQLIVERAKITFVHPAIEQAIRPGQDDAGSVRMQRWLKSGYAVLERTL